SKDARINNVIKLISYLIQQKWNAKALLVGKKAKTNKIKGLEVIEKGIPFSEIFKYSENSKIVIDIAHANQKGLSMRPFEALGLKRKLITNNTDIKNYDFYNPNNIFIIENFDNLDIPD